MSAEQVHASNACARVDACRRSAGAAADRQLTARRRGTAAVSILLHLAPHSNGTIRKRTEEHKYICTQACVGNELLL